MKRLLAAVFIILAASVSSIAQRHRPSEQIHAAKMAYITDRLQLSPRQVSDFIPVYNEYENEIRQTRSYFFKKYKGTNPRDRDDSTSRQFIDDNLDYQQKVIEIKRKYNEQFLRYISPQQLRSLGTAEREFKEMLIKRLDRQRGGRGYNVRRSRY